MARLSNTYDPSNKKAHYDTDVKVPEAVIQEIRELGMEGALQKAKSGTASPEFVEGVMRFYPDSIIELEGSLAPQTPTDPEGVMAPAGEEPAPQVDSPSSRVPAGFDFAAQGPGPVGSVATPAAISRRMGGGDDIAADSSAHRAPAPSGPSPLGTRLKPGVDTDAPLGGYSFDGGNLKAGLTGAANSLSQAGRDHSPVGQPIEGSTAPGGSWSFDGDNLKSLLAKILGR